MMALQKSDIEFIESPCGKMLATTDEDGSVFGPRGKSTDLSQLETVIERYTANKQYEEIVQTWLQVPPEQVDRVDLNTRLRYANALMYLHQEDQAAKVYGQIVDQMSDSEQQSTDLISLRKTLADLYTASGNYPAAEEQYKKISQDFGNLTAIDEWSKLQLSILERSVAGSPELTEYSGLLRNYLGFIPEKDGYKVVWQAEEFLTNYPYSAVSSNVDLIKKRAQEKADVWMTGFMGKVDELVAEKKFQEAIQLVDNAPVDLIDEEKRNSLKTKKDDFVLAEAVEKETSKLASVQELQQKWNSGMLLVKGERFEEAIAVFTEMLNTEYGTKAQEKIVEVSQLAAREERRKAADLFIRYTKTNDVEGQKKLLIESRKILKDILVKYPDVDIAEKVRGNIQRVEQEMNTIDPTLLSRVDSGLDSSAQQEVDVFDTNPASQAVQSGSAAQLPIIVQPPSQ
jgi:tetratricopeptide (TPR) repeat protein